MGKRLTETLVNRLPPAEAGSRYEVWDSLLPAFGVRVSDTGRRSWVLMYRTGGRLRRLTIGSYPALGVAAAREAARKALRAAQEGKDPAGEKQQARITGRDDVAAVVAEFIERHAKAKNRSWQTTERILKREILGNGGAADWRGRRIQTIGRRDILEMLDRIMDRPAPYQANRTLSAVRKLLNWTVERGILETSPAAGITPPGKEKSRERVLDDEEIRAVWAAFETEGYPFGKLFQFLLVTGQRVQEVATIRRSDVKRGVWTLPETKSGREHDVPLSPAAAQILTDCPRTLGGYVFSTTGGEKPVSGISKAKARVDALTGIGDWRLHDLRRTLATNMARLNVPPHVVERILNHSSGTIRGVAAVYNRHGYATEKGEALDLWGQDLTRIIVGEGRRDARDR